MPNNDLPQIAEQILSTLRRIIRAIDLHSRRLLLEFGLSGPQLVVLREVAVGGPLSGSNLARRISVSLPTVAGIVSRLEARGLVERQRSATDRRQMLVSITPAGQDLLHAAPPPLQERFIVRLGTLREWEQTELLLALQRVVAMMETEDLDASPLSLTGSKQAW